MTTENGMDITPTTHGLEPIDAAVLMKKYVVLLGMINYGTIEYKRVAKRKLDELNTTIHQHVNQAAFDTARSNLGIEGIL